MKKIFAKLFGESSEFAKDDKGIALLFTLGILGLMLVLALAFAATSMTELKIAEARSRGTYSGLLADSAFNRVMGLLSDSAVSDSGDGGIMPSTRSDPDTYFVGFTDGWVGKNLGGRKALISYVGSGSTIDSQINDELNGLSCSFSDSDGNDTDFFVWTSALPPCFWQSVRVDTDLIGRVAFVALDESGKVDPNYASHADQNRPGVRYNEINWKSAFDPDDAGAPIDPSENLDSSVIGKMASWRDVIGRFTEQSYADTALQTLFPCAVPTNESCVDTPTGDEYNRFNLARDDWDSAPLTINDILCPATSFDGTDTHGTGIFWLNNWANPRDVTNLNNTFFGPIQQSQQIAANLLDYCDSNDVPTSDVAPASWGGAGVYPAYTGNEKTPYINEVGFFLQVVSTITNNTGSPPPYGLSYSFTMYLYVEVVNMYPDEGFTSNVLNAKVLDGSLTFDYKNGTGADLSATLDLADGALYSTGTANVIDVKDNTKDMTNSTNFYIWKGESLNLTNFNTTYSSFSFPGLALAPTAFIDNVKLEINKIALQMDGNNVDLAMLTRDVSGGTNVAKEESYYDINSSAVGSVTKEGWYSFQAYDPRQNLNRYDYQYKFDSPLNGGQYNTGDGTGGDRNLNANPSAVGIGDDEVTDDPSCLDDAGSSVEPISTCYIRNAPMQSPWELGAIHRGARWQTINLSAYRGMTGAAASGGELYASGDANILDQVKMTNAAKGMKFNVNSPYSDALFDLIHNVRVPPDENCSDDYASPGTVGTAITTSANVFAVATGIKNANGAIPAAGGAVFHTRGELANATSLFNNACGVTQSSDAAKEAIIGKIINLTDIRRNYMTILAIAQGIQDVGGATITLNGAQCHQADGTKGLSSHNVTFDTHYGYYDSGDYSGDTYYGVDKIIGEDRVMGIVGRDSLTNDWKILLYERMD